MSTTPKKGDKTTHHCIIYQAIQSLPEFVKGSCIAFAINELHDRGLLLQGFNRCT